MKQVYPQATVQLLFWAVLSVLAVVLLASCGSAPSDSARPTTGGAAQPAPTAPGPAAPTTGIPTLPFPTETIRSIAEMIEAELADLHPGRILFNPPAAMTVGETERIEVRITRSLTDTETLVAGLQGSGEPRIEMVKVGRFMRARLTGENFEIEPLNNADQFIAPEDFTEWAWNVTPTWHGQQKLRLVVTVRININGTEEVRDLPVKEEVITVAVNPAYTVATVGQAYWHLALLTTLVIAGLSVSARMVATRRQARRRPVPQPGSGSLSPYAATLPAPQEPGAADTSLPEAVEGWEKTAPAPVEATAPPRLDVGVLVHDRYRIVRLIGKGGMGAVYEAVDQRLNNTVALKQMLVSEAVLERAFEREAQILARLRHPALPKVIDYFGAAQGKFLVMEFFAGADLAALLAERRAPFPVEQVLAWADQLLAALEYLHAQTPPVVHRDIKPQNVKVTAHNQIVLLDFGLAKGGTMLSSPQAGSVKSIFGYTPHYAPPEQIEGTGTEPRSDLYALAATLHHLLTGTLLPTALTRIAAQRNAQPDPLRPVHELNAQVAVAIGEVLLRALDLNINQRPASAAAMRAELQQASAQAVTVVDSKQTVLVAAPTMPGGQDDKRATTETE